MGTFVLTDAVITIDGTDLSDHGNQVTINYEAETQDDTAFGDDTRSNAGGLKNWSMDIQFLQDFDASQVDATLFPLVGTTFTVSVKADSATTSATNPEYTGSGLLTSYTPIGGSVGDQASSPISIVPGGSSPTLTRATS